MQRLAAVRISQFHRNLHSATTSSLLCQTSDASDPPFNSVVLTLGIPILLWRLRGMIALHWAFAFAFAYVFVLLLNFAFAIVSALAPALTPTLHG